MEIGKVKLVVGVSLSHREFSEFMINYLAEKKNLIEPINISRTINSYYKNITNNGETNVDMKSDSKIEKMVNEFENSMDTKEIYSNIYIFFNRDCQYDFYVIIGWITSVIDLKRWYTKGENIGFPQVYQVNIVDNSLINVLKGYRIDRVNYSIFNIIDKKEDSVFQSSCQDRSDRSFKGNNKNCQNTMSNNPLCRKGEDY